MYFLKPFVVHTHTHTHTHTKVGWGWGDLFLITAHHDVIRKMQYVNVNENVIKILYIDEYM